MTPEEKIKNLETELENLKKEYSEYAYIISHDFSAPLRHAYGFTQLVLDKDAENLSESSQRHLNTVLEACTKGKDMLEGLLLFSRVYSSKEEPEEVSSDQLVQLNVALFEDLVFSDGAKITFDKLPPVQGVRSQLQTVFYVLLLNALMYQKEGNNPIVHISCKDLGDFWEFSVKDNGMGINENSLETIFKPLRRGIKEDDFKGLGMGLPVARRIVERHGGHMQVLSEPGEGSLFSFTLPKESQVKID
jgi:two-component system phosphate regulon sensor histidine kinase PhoR